MTTGMVRATTSKSAGKWGFTAVQNGSADADAAIGIAGPLATLTAALGSDPYGWGLAPSGVLTHNGTTLTTIESYAVGASVMVVVDTDGKLLWIAVNGGNWNNDATQNPTTGAGGISVPGVSTYFPACSVTNSCFIADFNPGGLPTGFAPWLPPST